MADQDATKMMNALREGLERTYRWFVEHELEVRGARPVQ